MSDIDFVPRWASPPGDTIKNALQEQGLDRRHLAEALNLSEEAFDDLLAGDSALTIALAERLSEVIGGSVAFWVARDGQYHADQGRVAADAWAQRIPVKEMAALGWVAPPARDWLGRIDQCLRFFEVKNPQAWAERYEALSKQARFRLSKAVNTDTFAVAAWLRRCEIELSQISCGEWNRDAFGELLPQLVPLTSVRDPRSFLPELQERCADVGVAVGVVRAPRGCPVSGAARRLPNGNLSIALTGRYRADDHLWFTFFHEAAHLLLHGTESVYLDEIEQTNEPAPSQEEAEADEFAGALLVPPEYEDRLARAKRDPLELRRLAREIGVSPGIVIGHLQHRRLIGYKTKFNRLKTHYVWNGASLEKA